MNDLSNHVDRILEIIETDLKDILWNRERGWIKSIWGDYEVNTKLQGDAVIITIEPRRRK